MKTSMQELMDEFAKKADSLPDTLDANVAYVAYLVLQECYDIAKSMLEKERKVIEDAHIEGQRVFDNYPHTEWTNHQAEQYYNETFNVKDKHNTAQSVK
jgi:hypothetical protein